MYAGFEFDTLHITRCRFYFVRKEAANVGTKTVLKPKVAKAGFYLGSYSVRRETNRKWHIDRCFEPV